MEHTLSRPQSLQVSTDYGAALLWLMGDLKQARLSEVIATFQERFGDLIPWEHNTLNDSGYLKWDNYVRWARQALVSIGLMRSGGRGIWAITPEGEAWLLTHPDGGKEPLMRRLREQRAAQTANTDKAHPSKTYTATLNGQTFTFTTSDVLAHIRKALAEGVPQEARRFKSWHIVVDKQPLALKWVIAQVTGLPQADIRLRMARNILSALGFEPQSIRKASLPIAQPTSSGPVQMSREAFFAAVLEGLQERLPLGIKHKAGSPDKNFRELTTPVSRVRYILRLGYDYAEIGLHLIGPEKRNLQLLDQLRLHLDAINAQLEEPARAEPWRQRWARLYILRGAPVLTEDVAQTYAEDWLRFITVTLPLLEDAARSLGVRGKTRRATPGDKSEASGRAAEILNQKVATIRAYLSGNPTAAPSDEALCDWVRFCYDFEFFDEGARLFKLVRPNEVNAWLYERAKRFARVCEMRVRDHVGTDFQ